MTQSACIHQHHRGKKSNYLYHTKHNIAELTQCHQKHKYAKHISFLYNTAFKLLTSHPTALHQINFTEKHKEPKRDPSHEGANSPLACRGPALGIPTVNQNQEHSQQAESPEGPLLPLESLVSLVFSLTSQQPGDTH